jgi:hypothetical protein
MSETAASWQVEPHGRGRYTLARADTRVRITWTRRGYRCSCTRRRCCHVAALEAWLAAQGDEEPPETRGVSEMPPEETTMPKTVLDEGGDHPALQAHLAELRAVIDDATDDPACSLAAVLWRLRTLYREATGTDPWQGYRR